MVLEGGRFRVHERWDNARFSSGSWVHSVLRDASGAIWAGTVNEGLFRIAAEGLEQFRENEIGSTSVFGLSEDRDGRLWIATADGVAVRDTWACGAAGLFRLRAGRFDGVTIPGMDSSSPVLSLLPARDGSLWVGADPGGLARVRGDNAVVFGPDQGLPVMDLSAMVEDESGDLWLGGARKVAIVTRESLEEVAEGKESSLDCRVFDTSDGVAGPGRRRRGP